MPSIFQADLSSATIADLIAIHGREVRVYEPSGATRNITAIVEMFGDKIEHKGHRKYRVRSARVIATRSLNEGLGTPRPTQAIRIASEDEPDDRWTWQESERQGTAAVVAIYRKSTQLGSGAEQPK